jgi:hypothetical protein
MKHISIALAAVLLLGGSTTVLVADDAPGNGPAIVSDKGVTGPHPRLDEVFRRLGRQNKEIREEVRAMAENGGDLRRSEQRRLDSELNDVRMDIRSE